MGYFIDHHIVAGITIIGMVIDVLGALLLAYELLGGKEVGAKERPLRTLARLIFSGILGMFLGLLGFALGFPVAVKFHFHILVSLGYFSSLGELLGYASGWGFACVLGYVFSSRTLREPTSKRRILWFRKAGELGVWFVVGLICWFAGRLTLASKSKHR